MSIKNILRKEKFGHCSVNTDIIKSKSIDEVNIFSHCFEKNNIEVSRSRNFNIVILL